MDNSISALKQADRIQSLDIMRGIVLFGILLMNINGMGLGMLAYNDPTISGNGSTWDLWTWIVTNLFFEGTMRALFSMLFGVGMFILLDRLEKSGAGIDAANVYFRRLTWLLVFGLIHAYLLLWVGDILFHYALMGFLVFTFRKWSAPKLLVGAVCLFAIGAVWNYADCSKEEKFMAQVELAKSLSAEGKELDRELTEAAQRWEKMEWEASPEGIVFVNTNMRKGYLDVVAFLAPKNLYDDQHYPYRYDVWDILSMMLLGIALFKLNILSAQRSYAFYGTLAVIGYAVGISVNYYELRTIMDSGYSLLGTAQANISYDLGRVPVAMGHTALIMLFCKLPVLAWLKRGLAAVGKMALSNYVMHSVIALFIFTGAGLGLFGKLQRHELLYVVFGIWVLQFILSQVWLKHFQYGPLEWIWRNLSYRKRHAFRR